MSVLGCLPGWPLRVGSTRTSEAQANGHLSGAGGSSILFPKVVTVSM